MKVILLSLSVLFSISAMASTVSNCNFQKQPYTTSATATTPEILQYNTGWGPNQFTITYTNSAGKIVITPSAEQDLKLTAIANAEIKNLYRFINTGDAPTISLGDGRTLAESFCQGTIYHVISIDLTDPSNAVVHLSTSLDDTAPMNQQMNMIYTCSAPASGN